MECCARYVVTLFTWQTAMRPKVPHGNRHSTCLRAEAAGCGICGVGGHRAAAPEHARVPGAGRARVAGGVRCVACAGVHILLQT